MALPSLFPFPLLLLFHLPRLSASYQLGQVLHLTDFHMDPDYSPQGLSFNQCHKIPGQRGNVLGPIGDYGCDSSLALAEFAIAEAKRLVPRPDLLVWTGDTVPHSHDYSTDYVLSLLDRLGQSLAGHFPSSPVLPTLGNHDCSPPNQMPDRPNRLYFELFEQWERAGWLDDGQRDTFLRGGYYRKDLPGLDAVFLVLNTNLYFVFQNASAYLEEEDPAGQFAFLQSQLEKAQEKRRKVHILAHIAPGAFERTANFFWMFERYNRRLVELLAKYSRWIGWLLFGHNHTDTFRLIKDPKSGEPLLALLLALSVTPFNGEPTGNPAFRLYQFHPSNWSMADIKTFYVDLARLNEDPKNVRFSLEYSMAEAFQMQNDFSAHSFAALLERIKRDEAVFERYIRFNTVLYPEMGMAFPKGKERGAHLCALEFVQLEEYKSVWGNMKEASSRILRHTWTGPRWR